MLDLLSGLFQKQESKRDEGTFRGTGNVYLDCEGDYTTLFSKLIALNT